MFDTRLEEIQFIALQTQDLLENHYSILLDPDKHRIFFTLAHAEMKQGGADDDQVQQLVDWIDKARITIKLAIDGCERVMESDDFIQARSELDSVQKHLDDAAFADLIAHMEFVE